MYSVSRNSRQGNADEPLLEIMAHGFALHIEDDLRNYLQEISSTLDSDDTDVQQVISSALDEVEGKELKISTDAECSRFLEKLISHASPEQALHILGRVTSRDKLYSIACKCVPQQTTPQ